MDSFSERLLLRDEERKSIDNDNAVCFFQNNVSLRLEEGHLILDQLDRSAQNT